FAAPVMAFTIHTSAPPCAYKAHAKRSPRVDHDTVPTRASSGSRARTFLPLASSTIENPLTALLIWGRVQWNAGKISKPASLATGSARVAIGIDVGRSGRIIREHSGARLGAARATLEECESSGH